MNAHVRKSCKGHQRDSEADLREANNPDLEGAEELKTRLLTMSGSELVITVCHQGDLIGELQSENTRLRHALKQLTALLADRELADIYNKLLSLEEENAGAPPS